jgi:indole-3-glycerol phosphate synthase
MDSILEKIVAAKRREVAEAEREKSFSSIMRQAETLAHRRRVSFRAALAGSPCGVIAEFKRKSPSRGFINRDARVRGIVPGYEKAGAAAVSVLTDEDWFAGSFDDLSEARLLVDLPLLCKDFIIDRYQICQAKIAGADAVLLIAAALTPATARSLAAFARGLGLETLLEVHGESELCHLNEYVDVAGVNNRNLATFVTDVRVSFRLAGLIPAEFVKISESGISSPETVVELRKAGFRGFLMGENFMKQPDPAAALQRFVQAL